MWTVICELSVPFFIFQQLDCPWMFAYFRPGAFHLLGRRGMTLKETIIGNMILSIIFGALIGWTIGITDAFLSTPFNPYLLFTSW